MLSPIAVKEAAEGDVLLPGQVYLARGGRHMKAVKSGARHLIRYSDEPPREGVRPCANYMYESLGACSFEEVVCAVLTGMGADGTAGIKNLKIKYNKVFGYYLEVTNSYKDMVPDYYMRKQTLTNAERYITPELKELEDTILGAEEKLTALEYSLFVELREAIASQVLRIQRTAKAVAQIDVFASLAFVAERSGFVRPKMNDKGVIDIKGGRHPVVEKMIEKCDK